MPTVPQILNAASLDVEEVASLYPYGSRVYGTDREDSDYDYIIVAYRPDAPSSEEIRHGDLNIHVYRTDTFGDAIHNHEIYALECLFLGEGALIEEARWEFDLDRSALRREVSAKASNSWVKCKKKITVETDQEWIGAKSLFHSFRILTFGIQIATEGRITDYSAANPFWDEIREIGEGMARGEKWDWPVFNTTFKLRFNELASAFRQVAKK